MYKYILTFSNIIELYVKRYLVLYIYVADMGRLYYPALQLKFNTVLIQCQYMVGIV